RRGGGARGHARRGAPRGALEPVGARRGARGLRALRLRARRRARAAPGSGAALGGARRARSAALPAGQRRGRGEAARAARGGGRLSRAGAPPARAQGWVMRGATSVTPVSCWPSRTKISCLLLLA